ncbi:hypothetical protein C4K00_2542 [Pseudomonas synxantha]|nr:hypothetical protein C4K00_2542 [Pseudomonas synxantha]AZE78442.1 hypothetical protein C4J99_2657 [Pseudomonas synxantha]
MLDVIIPTRCAWERYYLLVEFNFQSKFNYGVYFSNRIPCYTPYRHYDIEIRGEHLDNQNRPCGRCRYHRTPDILKF